MTPQIAARTVNPRHEVVPVVRLTPEEIIEDLDDLARFGVGMVEAAHRVGKTTSACERFLYRNQREDLVCALWALNRGRTEPIRQRRRTAREHYAQTHGDWAAQIQADAAALLGALAPDDPLIVASRRAVLAATRDEGGVA